jgi:hypothetical protein
MSNPLPLNRIIDFNDTDSLDTTIVKLDKLSKALQVLTEGAVSRSKEYASAIQSITNNADELETQLKSLDATEKSNQRTILSVASATDQALKKSDILSDSLEEEKEIIIALTAQQEKLSKSKKELNDITQDEIGSLNDLKTQLKQATAEYYKLGDSVDDSVKDAALNRITELASAVNKGEEAVKQARKGVTLAAGSYDELALRVSEAKKQLKAMEGGVGSTSQEFKDLQKFVADGTDELKNFDKEIGDNKREVGNYGVAVEALDSRFGGLIGSLKQTGKELIAIASNPFVLTIAALVGAFALLSTSVKKFFETTGEGEDVAARQSAVWDQFFNSLNKGFASIGKSIANFFENAGGLSTVLQTALQAFKVTFPNLSSFIDVDSIQKRFGQTVDAAVKLADDLDSLDERIRENTVKSAQEQLEYNKLLEDSKNKLTKTDQERLEALQKAVGIQEQTAEREINIEKDRLALIKEQIRLKTEDPTDDQLKEISDQTAKVIQLEAQVYQDRRKNLVAINNLQAEIDKAERDRIERRKVASEELSKLRINQEINTNNILLADENISEERRLDLLNDNLNERRKLLEIERDFAIRVARTTAEERIRAEGKNVEETIKQDEALRIQQVRIQEKYNNDTKALYEQLYTDIETGYLKKLEQGFKNVSDQIATSTAGQLTNLNNQLKGGLISVKDYNDQKDEIILTGQIDTFQEQIGYLEKELLAYEDNAQERIRIEREIAEARQKLSDVTTKKLIDDINQEEAERKKYMDRLKASVEQIGAELFAFTTDYVNRRIENNIAGLEKEAEAETSAKDMRLSQLEGEYQQQLVLAQGNSEAQKQVAADYAQARVFIEQEAANKQRQIQKQIAAEKRKQAIFQKAADATSVIINTAKGIATAVAESPITFGLPWSAFVAVTGGLQLARILATPIPQYWRGVEHSPEGIAEVAEKGPEAIISPSGKLDIAYQRQYRYLKRGSTVINANKTRSLMEDARLYGDRYMTGQMERSYDRSARDLQVMQTMLNDQRIISELSRGTAAVTQAIKSAPQDVWDENGYRRYNQKHGMRVNRLDKRYKLP